MSRRRPAAATVPAPVRTVSECLAELQAEQGAAAGRGGAYAWDGVSPRARTKTLPLNFTAFSTAE